MKRAVYAEIHKAPADARNLPDLDEFYEPISEDDLVEINLTQSHYNIPDITSFRQLLYEGQEENVSTKVLNPSVWLSVNVPSPRPAREDDLPVEVPSLQPVTEENLPEDEHRPPASPNVVLPSSQPVTEEDLPAEVPSLQSVSEGEDPPEDEHHPPASPDVVLPSFQPPTETDLPEEHHPPASPDAEHPGFQPETEDNRPGSVHRLNESDDSERRRGGERLIRRVRMVERRRKWSQDRRRQAVIGRKSLQHRRLTLTRELISFCRYVIAMK
ncbi:uncharacterized protein LOC122987392 isoform X1 [Thunnus albacares]|uniref:uncharacterized protein LOC122987392 isoform X1 n=1 Tax=Thunnus albacares TaxID=8236 RepID=UPI001CF6768F|nr:uncharacterized protein LOC122987392 isoform X1 [Thunnus albacares]